jgi:hypothetical protein
VQYIGTAAILNVSSNDHYKFVLLTSATRFSAANIIRVNEVCYFRSFPKYSPSFTIIYIERFITFSDNYMEMSIISLSLPTLPHTLVTISSIFLLDAAVHCQ